MREARSICLRHQVRAWFHCDARDPGLSQGPRCKAPGKGAAVPPQDQPLWAAGFDPDRLQEFVNNRGSRDRGNVTALTRPAAWQQPTPKRIRAAS